MTIKERNALDLKLDLKRAWKKFIKEQNKKHGRSNENRKNH